MRGFGGRDGFARPPVITSANESVAAQAQAERRQRMLQRSAKIIRRALTCWFQRRISGIQLLHDATNADLPICVRVRLVRFAVFRCYRCYSLRDVTAVDKSLKLLAAEASLGQVFAENVCEAMHVLECCVRLIEMSLSPPLGEAAKKGIQFIAPSGCLLGAVKMCLLLSSSLSSSRLFLDPVRSGRGVAQPTTTDAIRIMGTKLRLGSTPGSTDALINEALSISACEVTNRLVAANDGNCSAVIRSKLLEQLVSAPFMSKTALGKLSSNVVSRLGKDLVDDAVRWHSSYFRYALGNLLCSQTATVPLESLSLEIQWFTSSWVLVADGTGRSAIARALDDSRFFQQLQRLWSYDVVGATCIPTARDVSVTAPSSVVQHQQPRKREDLFDEIRRHARKAKDEIASLIASIGTDDAQEKTVETLQTDIDRTLSTLQRQYSSLPPWLLCTYCLTSLAQEGKPIILNPVALHSHRILPLLVRVCRELRPAMRTLLQCTGQEASRLPILARFAVVAYVTTAHVLNHVLMVVGDDDWLETGIPLSVAELKRVAMDMNQVLLWFLQRMHVGRGVHQDDPVVDSLVQRDAYQMRSCLKRVLRQLVDRFYRFRHVDARVRIPKTMWLTPETAREDFFASSGNAALANHVFVDMPHAAAYRRRVEFVASWMEKDRAKWARPASDGKPLALSLRIRRSALLNDTFDQLRTATSSFRDPAFIKARWQVTFIDRDGKDEAGIDRGGPFKELIDFAVKHVFDPTYGLFISLATGNASSGGPATETRQESGEGGLSPNPHSMTLAEQPHEVIEMYRFAGLLLGKAVFEGLVVSVVFATFFLNNILGRGNSIDDLRLLDPTQHRSLKRLTQMDNASDAGLYFCVEDEYLGQHTVTDLIENGRNIPVTNDSVVRFLHAFAHHRLVTSTRDVTNAFCDGFFSVVDRGVLLLFTADEFQELLSGEKGARINIADLKQYVKFVGGFTATSRTVELLWDVLDEFSTEDQGRFLQFCTGSSRPPLLGFGALNPPFSIRATDDASIVNFLVEIDRLPSASTCFNLLKLPPYKSKSNLKVKLLQAIRSGTGFELS